MGEATNVSSLEGASGNDSNVSNHGRDGRPPNKKGVKCARLMSVIHPRHRSFGKEVGTEEIGTPEPSW